LAEYVLKEHASKLQAVVHFVSAQLRIALTRPTLLGCAFAQFCLHVLFALGQTATQFQRAVQSELSKHAVSEAQQLLFAQVPHVLGEKKVHWLETFAAVAEAPVSLPATAPPEA
jgi:hypothetical protein